jgi:hypothetical protein
MNPAVCVPAVCMRDSLRIPLGQFQAGHHELIVEVVGTVVNADSAFCTVVRYDSVLFDVPLSCPPSPGPLPFTSVIRIGAPPPCEGCPPPPICPGAPIPFHIAGLLPNECYEFRGLELMPSPIVGPMPEPPIARVTIAWDECSGRVCRTAPVPWQANAVLPPLPGRDYQMIVQLAQIIDCDSLPVSDTLFTTLVPFTVAQSCSLPPSPACFLYDWHGTSPDSGCTSNVGAGTPARLVLDLATHAPLAGLQGRLVLDPAALSITGLRPMGPAAGMHLVWQPLPDGATFVLFSESGAPIHSPLACATCPPSPVPVLEVTASARAGVPIPAVTRLYPSELLGSDSLGRAVTLCPTFAAIPPATICRGRSCDFNGDGRVDVRDLVMMVHCVHHASTCPDSTGDGRFDCNGDGVFTVDDVLCCARVILHYRMPDSASTRPAPDLRMTLGAPVATATGLEVPVHVHGADVLGAARLAFSYPADQFDAAEVSLTGGAAGWLNVNEAADGELIVGLIATGPTESDLDFVLGFRTAAGQSPGAVVLTETEFVATDGTELLASQPPASVPPGLAARIELSPARPNPFTHETQLTLNLTQAADVDLAVFDLSGRRVATLHRGPLPAGSQTIHWDGSRSAGGRAPSGVYIFRAQSVSGVVTRKLVLLRGD